MRVCVCVVCVERKEENSNTIERVCGCVSFVRVRKKEKFDDIQGCMLQSVRVRR